MASERFLELLEEIRSIGQPANRDDLYYSDYAIGAMRLHYSDIVVAVRGKRRVETTTHLKRLSHQAYKSKWWEPGPNAWDDIFVEAAELHIRKNAGYAGAKNPDPWANFRLCEELGVPAWLGCLVRMSDKFIRVQNLLDNPDNERVGESIADTLADLGAYALIAVCLIEERGRKQRLRRWLRRVWYSILMWRNNE